jgi:hypothetical protein
VGVDVNVGMGRGVELAITVGQAEFTCATGCDAAGLYFRMTSFTAQGLTAGRGVRPRV